MNGADLMLVVGDFYRRELSIFNSQVCILNYSDQSHASGSTALYMALSNSIDQCLALASAFIV